ncbi:MAG: helix-turn-helix domain-containing protein [Candidatus Melainabacteria bacterium]|nr:helix-turn-helix domain-containing protein [Candidatus Melainabacteria bacterium]
MQKAKTHEGAQINQIQRMQRILQVAFPTAKVVLDEPLLKTGVWMLDVILPDYRLAISWQTKKGFGLVADEAHAYGEGADEVFADLDQALPRVVHLINCKRPTVPPQAVRLKDIREQLGLSQEEVAKRLGKKQGAISRQESRSDCHISTLTTYVKALGCELVVKVVLPDRTEREIRIDDEL